MIIRLAEQVATPWKNGRGRTREMAVHPSGAGMDDFLWRVSVAEVDSAAPFSSFPGVDRVIVLLEGDGFEMTLDGARRHALVQPFEPFAFAGEAQVDVVLAGTATRDFNLMLRRAQVRGRVETWRAGGTRAVAASVVLVYCARGRIDSPDGPLQAGDTWRSGATSATLQLSGDAVALVVHVQDAS
jgi:environmental stress-induced protein Ves